MELWEKVLGFIQKIPKSYYLPLMLLMAVMIFFGIGLIQFFNHSQKSVITSDIPPVTQSSESAHVLGITVDVEGAVAHPGVYSLSQNARVQDALVAAGGLSANANREAVSQKINLAAKLTDSMKIYIPDFSQPSGQGSAATTTDYLGAQVHLIDLNSATTEELDSLPGIGSVTAQKIIAARPFSSITDLVTTKIVSSSVFQKVKDLVTVF